MLSKLKQIWAGWIGRALRFAILLLPVAWIAHNTDLGLIARHAASTGLPVLLVAFLASFSGIVLAAVRWRIMLSAYGATMPPPVSQLVRYYLIGTYYHILPTGLAGDVYRGYRVRRCLPSLGTSYSVVVAERFSGLVGLLAIATTALMVRGRVGDEETARTIVLALDIGLALSLVTLLLFLLLPYLTRDNAWLRRRVEGVPYLGRLLLRIPPARSLTGVAVGVLLSVGTQAAVIGRIYTVGRSISSRVTIAAFARVVPFVILLSYIPLTPASVGQRELLSVYFYGLVGVAPEEAVAISLLSFSIVLVTSIIGGALHLYEKYAGTTPPEDPTDQGRHGNDVGSEGESDVDVVS